MRGRQTLPRYYSFMEPTVKYGIQYIHSRRTHAHFADIRYGQLLVPSVTMFYALKPLLIIHRGPPFVTTNR